MKKIAALLALLLFALPVLAESGFEFSDVLPSDDCYETVIFACENGAMMPKNETEFGVNDPITVAQLAASLSVTGLDTDYSEENSLIEMAAYGIMPEDVDGTQVLTRELYAYYVSNFLYCCGYDLDEYPIDEYPDAADVDPDYVIEVGFVLNTGCMAPVDGKIDPKGTVTKAELADLVYVLFTAE